MTTGSGNRPCPQPPHPPTSACATPSTSAGITRTDQGAYGLVSGEKLSDAERDELRWLRNRTIQQRTADVFVQNTTDQRLIRNAFLQGFDT